MLTKNDISQRQFTIGVVNKILRPLIVLINEFSGIKNSLTALEKKNFKTNDYSKQLTDIKTALSGLNTVTKQVPQLGKTKIDLNKVDEVIDELKKIKEQIANIPKTPKPEKIIFPKQEKVVIPDKFSFAEAKTIIEELKNIKSVFRLADGKKKEIDLKPVTKAIKTLEKAIKKIPKSEIEFPDTIDIGNFPPTYKPTPVTHMSINSLSGTVHSTTTTVKATLTPLPGYGVLDNRRAIVFYNNSDNTTVYIGGSVVTKDNGLPIEAKSFSPSFDSGPLQKWYGITSSGTADVRCVEIPDLSVGR